MWTLNNGSGFKSQNCTWFHPLPTTPLELPLGEKTSLLSSKGQIERGWWESLKLTSLIIKLLFFTGILRDTWSPNIYVIASWIDLQNCWKIFPLSFFAVLGLPCQAISLAIPVWKQTRQKRWPLKKDGMRWGAVEILQNDHMQSAH